MDPRFLLIWVVLWTGVTSRELYVSTPTSIFQIDTTTLQKSTIINKENGRLLGLAADWGNDRLYYTDVSSGGSGIYTANLQGGDARKLPIQYPDMEPVGLAVDWVYGHLYWTDTVYRAVMMSNLDGTGRVTIVTKNLLIPRGIAVDPKRRELYVGDQGSHAVQICGLDGRDCRELNVTDGSATFWPNQITIDHVSERVHWTDGWIPAVYSCSVGGGDCRRNAGNLSADLGTNPAFGIAADQDGQFYLSTLHNQTLYRSTARLELTDVQIVSQNTKTFFLLNKETVVSQPEVTTSNPCASNKGGCSDICVAHTGDSFSCMCPDGSGKIPVSSVCQTPDQFLLYTDVSNGILGMASIDDPKIHTTIVRAVKPIAVTYHLVEKKVYFADARLRTIYKCDLDGGNIETVLNGSHGIGQVEGLSIDYHQNRLYFSNVGFEEYAGAVRSWHVIEMLDLSSKRRRTILTAVEKPRAVLVDSENRVLYYTDWGSAGHVGRVSLDGSNRVVLATAERPNDLVIHGNKLLVINNKEPTAELLELDLTTSQRTNQRPLSDTKPLSLSVLGSTLMISSFTGGLGIYTEADLSRTYRSSLGQFTRMTVVDTRLTKQRDEGLCSASGTCSGICVTLPRADLFTCLCPTNKLNELSPDRLSCQNPNSYILFADIDGIKMVSQGNSDDTHAYTIIYPSATCRHFYGLAVDEDQQYIYFSALEGNTIFRANADGTNSVKFVTVDNSKITSLALAGSDLFWTSTNSSDNSTGAICHCDTSDATRAFSVLYQTASEPLDIAADDSNVYWTERGSPGVKRFDRRESRARALVVSMQASAITLSVPSSHLFYATSSSVTLRRFPTLSDASVRRDSIGEAGARTLMATGQFLYVSSWSENGTGAISRHNLVTKNRYYVTTEAVRPGQMVYISNQASTVLDKAGSCPAVSSCSDTGCSRDVDCYGNRKCCGTDACTRCVTPDQGTDCIKNGTYIKDSGDVVVTDCEKCSCLNGSLTCAPIACPTLTSCPEESRVKPPGSCCPICLASTGCSRPPTIENCPSSTSTLLLPESSNTVILTIGNVIFASMYGKSCSGQKLNLEFPETTLKWEKNVQTVTVSTADRHGSTSCSLSVLISDKTKPTFEFCPNEVLQLYVSDNDRIVTWSPVTARDNSGSVKLTTNAQNGIARSPGLYDVEYKAEDGSGNSEQCSFSINVTMLRACKRPPIPFNGLLRCQDDQRLTCQLEKCYTGYVNTLSSDQQHVCDPEDGQWSPPFPSNFSNVCIKPEPAIVQRDYLLKFNCSNSKFEAGDTKECIFNARLCPSGDIQLCDLPFKRSDSSVVSPDQINITIKMEGTLSYGGDRVDLTNRMTNAGRKISDFFQTGSFKTKCPKIPCSFTESVPQADIRNCKVGSVTLNLDQEICAPCPVGRFYDDARQCSECPSDTYQERTGQTVCVPCADRMNSSPGSFLKSHCRRQEAKKQPSQLMVPVIVGVVVGAVVLMVVVALVFFCARKKSAAVLKSKTGSFGNPAFVGHGAHDLWGPEVEEYDQIPADKMLSESQIQNHKQKRIEENAYESGGTVFNEDQHTYEGLQGASNKGFIEPSYNSIRDYDDPRKQLLCADDPKEDNVYSTADPF